MIDDLFTELTIDAVDRLLAPETSREEAESELARLNARLSPRISEDGTRRDEFGDLNRELEGRLFYNYLRLTADDLEEISPGVHEWVLERLSQNARLLNDQPAENLQRVYFLFPETAVRHAVIALCIQLERMEDEGTYYGRSPADGIVDEIARENEMNSADQLEEFRRYADLVLDFMDWFPEESASLLSALPESVLRRDLREHLQEWADRLGGEAKNRIHNLLG